MRSEIIKKWRFTVMNQVLVVVCLVLTCRAGAQTSNIFKYEYDLDASGSGYHSGEGGVDYKASDGSFYISGITDISALDDDPLLIKATSSGTISFIKQYRINDADYITYGRLTSDGGYLMYGSMKGVNTASDILLIKTDASGNVSWARRLEVEPFTATDLITSRFDELAAGGYLLTGQVAGPGAGSGDLFVIKISSDGNTIGFANAYGTSRADFGYSIIEHSSGNIAVAGDLAVDGSGTPFNGWWLELNSSGTVNYSKSLGGSNNDRFKDILEMASGNYMLAGTWCSTNGACTGYPCSGCLVEITTAGAVNLRKIFYTSSPANLVFTPSCIYKTPDNSSYWIGGMIVMSGPDNNALMIKTSAASPSPSSGYSLGDAEEQSFSLSSGAVPGNNEFVLGGTEVNNFAAEWNSTIVKAHTSLQCNSSDVTFSTCNWTLTTLVDVTTTVTALVTNLTTITPTVTNRAPGATATQNCFQTLPVSLTSFTANYSYAKVGLAWTTSMEEGNQHFTLERSVDGLHYEELERITGAGYCSVPRNYYYEDSGLPANVTELYYRLSQTDMDGSTKQLGILVVPVSAEVTGLEMSIAPNPVTTGILFCTLSSENRGSIHLRVLDASGREVYSDGAGIYEGQAQWRRLELNHLSPGVYLLEAQAGNQRQTCKFLLISGE